MILVVLLVGIVAEPAAACHPPCQYAIPIDDRICGEFCDLMTAAMVLALHTALEACKPIC